MAVDPARVRCPVEELDLAARGGNRDTLSLLARRREPLTLAIADGEM
jgi:hypothetical protein